MKCKSNAPLKPHVHLDFSFIIWNEILLLVVDVAEKKRVDVFSPQVW